MRATAVVVLFVTVVISALLGLLGGVLLLWREKVLQKITHELLAFAVGAMLGVVMFDLLPESFADGASVERTGIMICAGILLFYLIEKYFVINHCHTHGIEYSERHKIPNTSAARLVSVGDTIHNFLDGVVIATAFLVSIPLGIVTAIAQVAHELPQEVGDFSIMLASGMKRGRVILWNIVSGMGSLIGALAVVLLSARIETLVQILLPVATGGFLYIALSDLIPELHHETRIKKSFYHFVLLCLGLLLMWLLGEVLHE